MYGFFSFFGGLTIVLLVDGNMASPVLDVFPMASSAADGFLGPPTASEKRVRNRCSSHLSAFPSEGFSEKEKNKKND